MLQPWSDLTSSELARIASEPCAVALLPVAAIEQHGPHLPLSTDLAIAHGLLAELRAHLRPDVPVLELPAVAWGDSTEHTAFAGTVSLAPQTLIQVLIDVGRAVAAAGIRRLVLFNTHGGNRAAIDIAALQLRRELGLLAVKANYFLFPQPEQLNLPAAELRHGLHGGLVETSLMLHLAPDAVRRDRASDARSLGQTLETRYRWLRPQGPGAFAWMAQDLHASGVVGNAAGATAVLGGALARHYARILADLLHDASEFELGDLQP